MIIRIVQLNCNAARRPYYYKFTEDGRAVLGHKDDAALFTLPQGKMVLRHLKQFDHRFADGELIDEMDRKAITRHSAKTKTQGADDQGKQRAEA